MVLRGNDEYDQIWSRHKLNKKFRHHAFYLVSAKEPQLLSVLIHYIGDESVALMEILSIQVQLSRHHCPLICQLLLIYHQIYVYKKLYLPAVALQNYKLLACHVIKDKSMIWTIPLTSSKHSLT